ncbi:aldose 1-epimerase family protein [Microbacterium fluvii]|uniref:Aldose 1-epimerase family protein n=1 Tax=Microbacterium fluvii TaxID=415215 RepID=A0ABW2HED1_9MICO|nr:aldose 1-epimerase family protein [Microbacterium fluvii]MCU4673315.1 aldose 1-epimerase family protein [Microbacterium fluvii]
MVRTPLSGTQHALRAGDYEAVVASVGGTLRSLTHRGRDLIAPFGADEVRPSYRGALLAPWPNRIVDGRYGFAGADHQVALTEPARHHALHGLAAWLPFEAVDKGPDHVTLAAVIEPQTGYPWRITVATSFALGPDGLTQTVTARNDSADAAPFGTGPHPYLVAGPGTVDDWTLELPAADVLLTDDRLSPVALESVEQAGADRFDFRAARAIEQIELDHAYTGLDADAGGTVTVRVTAPGGTGVAMSWGASCPWVQVHTSDKGQGMPGHRAGLAVEPMTCAPDAFNADRYAFDTGLQVIEPGASVEASWLIAAI